MAPNINPDEIPSPFNKPTPASPPPPPPNQSYGFAPLPSFSSLLGQALSQFRYHWKTFFGILSLPFLLSITPFVLVFIVRSDTILPVISTLPFIQNIVQIFSTLAVMAFITSKANPPSAFGAYKTSFSILLPLLLIGLLSAFTMYGGIPLLIFPAIVLSILLIFSGFAFLVDGRKGWNALTTSWYYARNHKFAIFGRIFLLGILVFLIGLVFGFINFFLSIYGLILFMALTLIYIPIWLLFLLAMYENLKQIKPPPSPEEEQKIRGRVKIFFTLGIIAVIAFVGFVYYGISNTRNSNSDFWNLIKEEFNNPTNQIDYQP